MSANRDEVDTDRSAAEVEAGSEPLGDDAPDQAGADQISGERIDAPSASDLGPGPGSGDGTPRHGEVF